jgi:exonuclease III
MEEAQMDILGLCEIRWAGKCDFIQDDVQIIYSGSEKSEKISIAVILKGKWKKNVLNTYHVDDRILMNKLNFFLAAPTNIYFILVYFPTYNSSDEEIDVMCSELEELLNFTEEKSNVLMQGDFNASVG